MKNLKTVLIYLLLFLLPTQFGKHFFLPFSFISGLRIDYLAPTIYLTDIISMITILFSWNKIKIKRSKTLLIFLSLLLVNIIFSLSPFISMYIGARIIIYIILFLILKEKLQPKYILMTFTGSALIQLLLVLYQIIEQHSLQGIAYLFGERYFSISTPGIAKISLQGVEILRGYGSFSHPNSLAGFFVLLYSYVLFEKKFNKFLVLKYFFMSIATLLIFLSFSKVGIITFLIVTSYYVFKTIQCKLCKIARILLISVLSLLFISTQGDLLSYQKRIYLIQSATQIILQHPLFGTGIGAYIVAQAEFPIPYSYLFLQPVHNIFLLLLAEIGIIPFSILIFFIYKWLKKHQISELSLILIFVVCFTGLFDHYWLTLQQNMLLIPVVFALVKHQKWS